jgi:cold shock protein
MLPDKAGRKGAFIVAAGKVKWFNNAKGYGFILPIGGGDDLFVHYSSIQMEGYKTLKAGQDVEFDLLEGPKGNHAVNIRVDAILLSNGDSAPNGTAEMDSDISAVQNGRAELTS